MPCGKLFISARRPSNRALVAHRSLWSSHLFSRAVYPLRRPAVADGFTLLQNARRWAHFDSNKSPSSLPRYMNKFSFPSSSHSSGALDQANASSHSSTARPPFFPPWPVDAIEFSTALPDGGHALRGRFAEDLEEGGAVVEGGGALANPSSPVAEKQGDPSAIRRGWTCESCGGRILGPSEDLKSSTSDDHDPTSAVVRLEDAGSLVVCPHCRAPRLHAVANAIAPFFLFSTVPRSWWVCGRCGEYNHYHPRCSSSTAATKDTPAPDSSELGDECRCCKAKAGDSAVWRVVHRESPSAATKSTDDRSSQGRGTGAEEEAAPPVPPKDDGASLASRPLGAIVNGKNKTVRWRCFHCAEINSLQTRSCRHCHSQRFHFSVQCPHCSARRTLNNSLVYRDAPVPSGTGPASQLESSSFSGENCSPPFAGYLRCLQCEQLLHGGLIVRAASCSGSSAVSSPKAALAWWCACGVYNPPLSSSCLRCRLPRWLPREQYEPVITKYWDLQGSSHWWCEACQSINTASVRRVTMVPQAGASSASGEGSRGGGVARCKGLRRQRGQTICACCGEPWHLQLLFPDVISMPPSDAERVVRNEKGAAYWWRCACHSVNRSVWDSCGNCGLPALPVKGSAAATPSQKGSEERAELSADVLSDWVKGDWLCGVCLRHNYKDRAGCYCGAPRGSR